MMNKTKFFGLSVLIFLTLVVTAGFTSAASLAVSNINFPSSVSHNGGSFQISFDITNTGAADPAIAFTLQMTSGQATLTMPTVPIADGSVTPVTISVSGTVNYPAFQDGTLAGAVISDDQGGGAPKNAAFSVLINNAPSLKVTKKTSITQTSNGSIEVENDGNIDWSNIQLTDSGDFTVKFYDGSNEVTSISLNSGAKKTLTVVADGLDSVGFGGEEVLITATANDGTTTGAVTMTVEGSFCEAGSVGGGLEITDVKIDNTGEGKDDEWHLLNTVEVEIQFENVGNDDLEDIFIEIGFFDSDGKNQVSDLEFENSDEEEFDYGDLDEGDDDTVTFKFRVPADFEDGNYKLTAKVYSDKSGEDVECTDTASDFDEGDKYALIDVERESDQGKFIAFENVEFTPTEASCGDRISMTLDVFNVGDEDQDQVKITLKNTELGINEFVEIRTDLDQGDKETVSFDFVVPDDAKDKFYTLALSAEYDYNRGTYREELDEDTEVPLKVIGCGTGSGTGTGSTDRIAIISASLDSEEVVAGGEVIVKATVTNLKSQRTAFAIDALGYQSWATLDEISPRILDLAEGESKDVFLTFIVDEDVEGEKSFDIEVKDGLGGTETREIALNIEGSSASSVGFDFGDSAFLWVIGAVNVILVVLIIVVAVRVARR
ncbi:MAG: putative S-layer protein [archaeon]